MNIFLAYGLTFISGLFLLIGTFIAFKFDKNKNILGFSLSLAFSVLLFLGIFEILPESFELLSSKFSNVLSAGLLVLLVCVGIGILKLVDLFIPEHNNEEKNRGKNLKHIAIVTTIAVFIHNIIEGMAIYSSLLSSLSVGLVLIVGVGVHNIALGLSITSEFYTATKNKTKTTLLIIILSIANLIGAFIMSIFNIYLEENLILGIMLSITLGMIFYLVIFELLGEIKKIKDNKIKMIGFLTGILIMLIATLI